ncbi:MAG: PF20097 family protein [Planctomycetota bacterium]
MLETVHENMRCPKCRGHLEEGALSVSNGLRWKRMKGMDLADMSEHLPNTHATTRPNHLIAYRCRACALIVVEYGRTLEQHPGYAEYQASQAGEPATTDSESPT